MNIFILDEDPATAARMQCNKHVVKMILETCQMLSTALHLHGVSGPWKPTHSHHPCTVWAAETKENWMWLWKHGQALSKEYTYRYGKVHACQEILVRLRNDVKRVKWTKSGLTSFAQAMPEQHRKKNDPVSAYRTYYIADKQSFAKWTRRKIPTWFSLATTPSSK